MTVGTTLMESTESMDSVPFLDLETKETPLEVKIEEANQLK